MRAALIEAGYRPSDLRKSQARRVAPPSWKTGHYRLYRWSEVEAWAKDKRKRHKIDLGKSTLGRWLKPRETAGAFARRLELPRAYVYRLIGHKNSLWRKPLPPEDVLVLISLETGIPVATLIADAPEDPF